MTEDLTAQVDGTTTAYTSQAPFMPGSLKVYVDGVRYTLDDDYTETDASVDEAVGFVMATPIPVGSKLVVDYDTGDGVFNGLIASGT